MKIFSCAACGQTLFFENSQCTKCGHALAFLPDHALLSAGEPAPDAPGFFVALAQAAKGVRYRQCGNQIDHAACNWAQVLEGSIDSAHSSSLHSTNMPVARVSGSTAESARGAPASSAIAARVPSSRR